MSRLLHLSEVVPKENDKYLLDANIWMHLYCSVGNYFEDDVNAYSTFFQNVLEAGSKIYITSMMLSEFFNAYCKVEYYLAKGNRHPKKFNYKKHFRKSEDYEALISLLQNIVSKKILPNTIRLSDQFEILNIQSLFEEKIDFDFNDQYYIQLCEAESINIVTHDKDFFGIVGDIDIITNLKDSQLSS
ncbi:PIN domain-containing protein [Bacillus sp. AK031]